VKTPSKKGHKKTVVAFSRAHGGKRKCTLARQCKRERFSPLKMGTLIPWAVGGGVLEIAEDTIRAANSN